MVLTLAGVWAAAIGATVLLTLTLALAGESKQVLRLGVAIGAISTLGIAGGISALLILAKVPST